MNLCFTTSYCSEIIIYFFSLHGNIYLETF